MKPFEIQSTFNIASPIEPFVALMSPSRHFFARSDWLIPKYLRPMAHEFQGFTDK
jgi:hypothetical protein